MTNKLWVDDLRDPTNHVEGEWTWAKTSKEAFQHLKSNSFEVVSLDNDLGEPTEGIHIFDWIEERLYWKDIDLDNLKAIYVHSSNVEAVRRILSAKHNMKSKYGIQVAVIGGSILK
jgi:hypothetical protein